MIRPPHPESLKALRRLREEVNQRGDEQLDLLLAGIEVYISIGREWELLEIMRKFAPQVLVVAYSDVEAAHFGSYSLHMAGIKTADRLTYQLWQEIESNPDYRDKTTMVVLPEFGRDPDGSSTNGFFNHRANTDSTRDTWMMTLGAAVDRPQIIERPIRHIDLCPTLTNLLGCRTLDAQGQKIAEMRA